MEWVEGFYSTTGRWWGPAEAGVTQEDHDRVARVRAVCGEAAYTMLELGCGYGCTAAAAADHGFAVTGVDIAARRLAFAEQHAARAEPGTLRFVHADFYEFDPPERFDVVCYWNGFGVGADADQRRLLRRIRERWLAPGGRALIDVANPLVWAGWAGDVERKDARPERGYQYSLVERVDFDPVANRFVDTWWEQDDPEHPISQSVRCYTPADLRLLLEGTGLELAAAYAGDEPIALTASHLDRNDLLKTRYEWLAVVC